MPIILLALLLILSIVLVKSADQVVISLRRLSRSTHANLFALSAVLVAFATSIPELFVGIMSSLQKTGSLSLGNVLGANMTNISLIAGASAVIVGHINIHEEYIKKEVLIALFASFLPVVLFSDGNLSRIDGALLIIIWLVYTASFFQHKVNAVKKEHIAGSFIYRFVRKFSHVDFIVVKELARFVVGLFFLLLSAGLLVTIAKDLATAANIPLFIIGLVVVSIGTTLPELVFSIRSVEDHHPTMFFGNLLGSIIVNSTLVIGLTCLINPFEVEFVNKHVATGLAFVVIFLTFWLLIRKKRRVERWEGVLLLILYIVFIVVEFI